MNNIIRFLSGTIAAGVFAILGCSAQCQVLYENSTTFLGNFNVGNAELGNQVSLFGTFTNYFVTDFLFQFDFTGPAPALNVQSLASNSVQLSWPASFFRSQLYSTGDLTPPITWSLVTSRAPASNGSFYVTVPATNAGQFFRLTTPVYGNELADLRFYKNDGVPVAPSEAPSPGTLIFDSGTFPIGGFTLESIVTFDQTNLNGGVVVPRDFTWTVTFSGLSADETAGLALYATASVGTNYGSAWYDDSTNWQFLMAGSGDPPPNFGAIIFGTPLPQLDFTTQSGALVLTWPASATGFFLEMTTNLLSPIRWTPVTNGVVINGQNFVTNTMSCAGAFYRLVNDTFSSF
jgi:hypothetical protein